MSEEIPANDCDYFYSLLDGITVNRKFAGTHLCTWVETGTVRVQCLARKQKTVSHGQAHYQRGHRASHEVRQKSTKTF